MSIAPEDLKEFHWVMTMIQHIDVGLVVLNRNYEIQVWNGFMENHSIQTSFHTRGRSLFEVMPDIDEDWFRSKAESVFNLRNRAFTTWEQRPYLFKFKNSRPITGTADFMYQNSTIFPLESTSGEIEYISLLIYDVTDVAVNSLELNQANQRLEKLSQTDLLTGLNNRGYLDQSLEREFKRLKRTKEPASVVIFDIDHFKKVNDNYGHLVGDKVIQLVAKTLMDSQRETDVSGRFGGEEFVILLIGTPADSANFFAERLRKKIEKTVVETPEGDLTFTISLGIAEFDNDIRTSVQWLNRADQALYNSKESGRNKTTIYSK